MAAVFTRRFGAGNPQVAGAVTAFTADDLHDYVIRDVVVMCQNALTSTINIYIAAPGPPFFTLAYSSAQPGLEPVHWEGRQQILSSETLVISCSESPWSFLVTGYALGQPT